jgi:hypothetical protein
MRAVEFREVSQQDFFVNMEGRWWKGKPRNYIGYGGE